MRKFNKVAIIGVGGIGSSIGIDLRRRHLAKVVMGIGRRKKSLRDAKNIGAVDKAFLLERIKDGIKNADLIILATPITKIVVLGKKIIPFVKPGAIITDVGSTKKYVVKHLEKAFPKGIAFVGSHPMAGSEKSGPLNARANIFVGHNCFITKTKNTDRNALNRIKTFWRSLGAKTIEISPEEHDSIVAKVSQMTHIVASTLVISNKDALKFAASGFQDTTRIALSDPEVWKDICMTNNKEIVNSLDKFIKTLGRFKKAISQKKASQIKRILEEARGLRQKL